MTEPLQVFLASRNAKKIEELRRILDRSLAGGPGIEVLGLDDVPEYAEPVEDHRDRG